MQALVALGAVAISSIFAMPSAVSMISSKPIRFLRPLAALDLGDQHIDGVDVGGGANLGDHDQVDPLARVLHHVHDVAIHVMGVEPVDANRQGLVAPIDIVDRFDDVLARLRLVVRRYRVFKVQEDDVGGRFAAFSNSFGLLPGTASSLRLSRAGAGSTILKLIPVSPSSYCHVVIQWKALPRYGFGWYGVWYFSIVNTSSNHAALRYRFLRIRCETSLQIDSLKAAPSAVLQVC